MSQGAIPNTTTTNTVVSKAAVPPPLTGVVVVPKPINVESDLSVDSAQEVHAVQVTNGHSEGNNDHNKKKRKRSASGEIEDGKAKRVKLDDEQKEKKKKKKNKQNKKREEKEEEESDDDHDETTRNMSKVEFEAFVNSIMEITRCEHPKTALIMLERKLTTLDELKTWFGLDIGDDDAKLMELVNDNQLRAIYKGMVMGKLVLSMDEYQKDGPSGFINHILDSKAAGKHLVPYAFCCWDPEKNNIQSSLQSKKRDAAINPQSNNFWLLNQENEIKKALRRTKFWYAFANEMANAIEAGAIDEERLSWEDVKMYCEAFWYENPEARQFKKYWINVYADKQSQLVSYPAWPIPKGSYKEEKDFVLGVWPFVQIYFMSPKEGPVVLLGDKKDKFKNKDEHGAEKPRFDFIAALEKRQAKHGGKVARVEPDAMIIEDSDDDDDDDESQVDKHKKDKKNKKKKHKSRLSKFIDSQAEEDDD